jgi:hypothetical protein
MTVASDPANAGRYTASYEYDYIGSNIDIYIVVLSTGYQALRPEFELTSVDSSLQIAQQIDRQYENS